MVGKTPLLSIVCPAYQEEAVLPDFHLELSVILAGLEEAYNVEIIYVDDGSSDRTLRVLRDLARNDRRVRYLSLSRNFGHQAALTAGLEHARGDLVISMDSDLQHPPALVRHLLSFSKLPLRLSLLLGLIAIVFSLAFAGGAFISLFSAQRSSAMGMMLLFSSIQFMGGCILLSLGIVGEYVGRIYQQVKGRPLYLLQVRWPQTDGVSRAPSARNQSGSAAWSAEQDQSAAWNTSI